MTHPTEENQMREVFEQLCRRPNSHFKKDSSGRYVMDWVQALFTGFCMRGEIPLATAPQPSEIPDCDCRRGPAKYSAQWPHGGKSLACDSCMQEYEQQAQEIDAHEDNLASLGYPVSGSHCPRPTLTKLKCQTVAAPQPATDTIQRVANLHDKLEVAKQSCEIAYVRAKNQELGDQYLAGIEACRELQAAIAAMPPRVQLSEDEAVSLFDRAKSKWLLENQKLALGPNYQAYGDLAGIRALLDAMNKGIA